MFKITVKSNSVVISNGKCSILVDNKGTKVSGLDTLEQKEHTFIKRIESFFMGYLSDYKKEFNAISGICNDIAPTSKSWRAFSNNLRRGVNQHLVAIGLTTNAEFQGKYFYEGTMEGRTTHGATAPWLGQSTTLAAFPKKTTPAKKAVQTQENDDTFVGAVEAKGPYKPYNFDMNNQWDKINKGIADRIAQE